MSGVANVGVTVGMPVYNGDRFLRAALESILAQTHEDFALFISDNGSTDDTQEICRHFASRDERISYERHEQNLGAAWNYNRVFLVSGGAYFKWAAADDLLAPTCLERCVETLSNAPDSVVIVYPKTRIVDASGMVVGDWDDELDVRSTRPSWRFNRVVRNFVLGNPVFGLARRDALERTQLHGDIRRPTTCSSPSSHYVARSGKSRSRCSSDGCTTRPRGRRTRASRRSPPGSTLPRSLRPTRSGECDVSSYVPSYGRTSGSGSK